jgi:hypothetical protein
MRQKSNSTPVRSEKLVRNIRRATRKHHAAALRTLNSGLVAMVQAGVWKNW